jgi:hypothetical protein
MMKLRLLAGGGIPLKLRAGGLEPSVDMAPGRYTANCAGGKIITKGRNNIVMLEFSVIEGSHAGTGLRQWISLPDVDGVVSVGSRYARQCAIALGREIEPGDDLDPAAIFRTKTFVIEVGYRKTLKIGGTATDANAQNRKDAKDFLRVHEIIEMVDSL